MVAALEDANPMEVVLVEVAVEIASMASMMVVAEALVSLGPDFVTSAY